MLIIPAASTNDTEAGKLWSLTAYAWNILLEKQIHEYCELGGLDFDIVYRSFTESYNKGFAAMGRSNVARPVLSHVDGPIGGHCVIPAAEKLAAEGDRLAALVVDWNQELEPTDALVGKTSQLCMEQDVLKQSYAKGVFGLVVDTDAH